LKFKVSECVGNAIDPPQSELTRYVPVSVIGKGCPATLTVTDRETLPAPSNVKVPSSMTGAKALRVNCGGC
jgi:hypothetical protein